MKRKRGISGQEEDIRKVKSKIISNPTRKSTRLQALLPSSGNRAAKAEILPSSPVHDSLNSSKENIHQQSPVTHWVYSRFWPLDFSKYCDMPEKSKKRSNSTHGSDRLKRTVLYGVHMDDDRPMKKASKDFCNRLLTGTSSPPGFPMYPADKRGEVIRAMRTEPEATIQSFITPIVIPSVASLRWYGRIKLDHFGDEMNALWTRAETMGSTQPKPDYIAGLRMTAFNSSVWDKLMYFATPSTPVLVTALTCYPFIIGEVKSPWIGIQVAEEQSLHAAGIALKSQFSLYWQAYGKEHRTVKDLYGQALVFSICHNNDTVNIFGHYAYEKKDASEELEFFRTKLQMSSLTLNGGRDQDVSYNFVEKLHKEFSPKHLKRIKDAAARLPEPAPKTALSFNTGQLNIDLNDPNEMQPEGVADETVAQELAALRTALEGQRKDMETQRQDAKDREQKLEKQLEDQRKDSKQQMEDLRELMNAFKKELVGLRKSKEELEELKKSLGML